MTEVRRAARPSSDVLRRSPDLILTDPKWHEQSLLRRVLRVPPSPPLRCRVRSGSKFAENPLPSRSGFAYNASGAPTRLPFRKEVRRKPRPFPPALRPPGPEPLHLAPATTHVPLARAQYQHGRTTVMRTCFRLMTGACLIALTVGLILAARPASAQAPAPATAVAPAPAAANAVVPRLTNPPASAAVVAPPRVATPNAVRPQARVYTVPSQGASSIRQRQRLSWPTRRYLAAGQAVAQPELTSRRPRETGLRVRSPGGDPSRLTFPS